MPADLSIPDLVSEVDLAARVVYFPVRHHSPACAWHVRDLIRSMRPDVVLIEGPRDATPQLDLLRHADTQMPVAFYMTYVRRPKQAPVERFAGYYPLCDYSPELVAIRTAAEVGARVEMIDLTFAEKIEAESAPRAAEPQNLLGDGDFFHGRLVGELCERTGARDSDDLWDRLFEVNAQSLSTARFAARVLAYCTLARRDISPARLATDGTLAREAAMAAAIAAETGRVLVITGGIHTVALPQTAPKKPKPVKVPANDRLVVLMRYSFEQLDRLNGYASGMPAPEFYQRQWDDRPAVELLVELARECREQKQGLHAADCIAAGDHMAGLSQLRGHVRASREDLLDAIRSVFIKGADDIEGVPILANARKLLAGSRIGSVPAEAGQPPIVQDFRERAARHRLSLDRVEARQHALDLYRSAGHRDTSRFFHQLRFLDIPFAKWEAGPDFVAGEDLERIQEVWRYRWSPETESSLIERSIYGPTVEVAATARLWEQFEELKAQGQGRRADVATRLVLESCRMGLHAHTPELMAAVATWICDDSLFESVTRALHDLLILKQAREPLEAHALTGLEELAIVAFHRGCYLLPMLSQTPAGGDGPITAALASFRQGAHSLGETTERQELLWLRLAELVETPEGNGAICGAAVGLLFADGQLDETALATLFRNQLRSPRDEGTAGAQFLRGLMRTARSALWQVRELLAALQETLHTWDEDEFIRQLPNLRLALADISPRECDGVAREVAGLLGVDSLQTREVSDFSAEEMVRALRVNQELEAILKELKLRSPE